MDLRIRKFMVLREAIYPRDDVERLYIPRKVGGRGLASIEDHVDTTIHQVEDYIKHHGKN